MKISGEKVKECLRPDEGTAFQLLIAKMRNTNRDSYWNQELGKTRYRVSNLPVGMDPNEITFGKPYRFDGGFAEIMKSMITDVNENPEKGLNEHKIKRHGCPIDKLQRFGKKSDSNWEGLRAKKLLQWINPDPVTKVICLQADFYNRSQPQIGEVKIHSRENEIFFTNFTCGKPTNPNRVEVSETLKQSCSINPQIKKISKGLENINKTRVILKRRGISFTEIEKEFEKFDIEDEKVVDIKILFHVLKTFQIFPGEEVFCELLKMFKYLNEDKVNYTKAINLLNWNCDFPEIPKTEEADLNNYVTTYNKTIGNFPQEKIPQDTVKRNQNDCSKYNQSIIEAAITPNIFSNFGLTHEDLIKPRSKEIIQSIARKLKDFPEEKFNSIWEEGLKMDQTGGVCILTFKNILENLVEKMTEINQTAEIKTN